MKTPYVPEQNKFDLNFLLCGNSGCGKTHLCATYDLGPVHYYMIDKGGEVTLNKLLKKRSSNAPIVSIDKLSDDTVNFSTIWKKLQTDQKEGFFNYMRDQNGLIVIDSLTSINRKAIREIGKNNGIDDLGFGKKIDMKKDGMQMHHWGRLLQWMTHFVGIVQDFPCATATTVHLYTQVDGEQTVVGRYPSVNGQLRQTVGVDFDETYLLELRKDTYRLHFKEKHKFEAKTRAFAIPYLDNANMNMLATAYVKGDTLEDQIKEMK